MKNLLKKALDKYSTELEGLICHAELLIKRENERLQEMDEEFEYYSEDEGNRT
jgi:hypothetical protein